MADPKQKKTERRTPRPKSKQPVIPNDFKITKNINPFQQIWDAAEPSKSNPLQNSNPVQSEGGSKFKPGSNFEGGKGFLQIPNELLDSVFSELQHAEIVIYLRLYRLSHGFGQTSCQVSVPTLAKRCKCSENTVRNALKRLSISGLIRVGTVTNTGTTDGGISYEVFTKLGEAYKNETILKSNPPSKFEPGSNFEPGSKFEPIKDHDDHDHDDFLKTDHHQRETMMIYQTITGNKWKKSDDEAYKKIKELPLEKIEQGIRLANKRSTSRPNSLNYFVKEIVNLANPSEQSKAQRKKALEKIINRIRENQVGGPKLTISDFAENVKLMAAREGVLFDNDLFNQILGI